MLQKIIEQIGKQPSLKLKSVMMCTQLHCLLGLDALSRQERLPRPLARQVGTDALVKYCRLSSSTQLLIVQVSIWLLGIVLRDWLRKSQVAIALLLHRRCRTDCCEEFATRGRRENTLILVEAAEGIVCPSFV